jgi:hypothetical protein
MAHVVPQISIVAFNIGEVNPHKGQPTINGTIN